MLFKKQAGMTLIEVLIAALILFMAIGLVSSAFQQALMLQRKVVDQKDTVQVTQWIRPVIEFELENGRTRGVEEYLGTTLSWEASLIEKKQFVDSFGESESYVAGRGFVSLYQVSVLQEDSLLLEFKEVLWSEQ